MCIKHHTQYSVESVTERGATSVTVFNVWNRSTGCRRLNNTRALPRVSWTGVPFTMVSKCCSETSTDQYIVYNIKRTVRKFVSYCENDSVVFDLESPLDLPRPPKRKIHNLPKNVSPSNFHHQCVDPRIDSMDSPHP
jgi:hypothetical protein